MLMHRYSIDETHSNSCTAWKKMGSPQQPSPEQYAALEEAGELQQADSPQWITVQSGETKLGLVLPRQSVSLLQVSW
jgi:xylan 1,4-beta-xylosidase